MGTMTRCRDCRMQPHCAGTTPGNPTPVSSDILWIQYLGTRSSIYEPYHIPVALLLLDHSMSGWFPTRVAAFFTDRYVARIGDCGQCGSTFFADRRASAQLNLC